MPTNRSIQFRVVAPRLLSMYQLDVQQRMKSIVYRGGVARFDIPENWREEYEPAGGATFYEPGDTTGTLRLNVLSFKKNDDSSSKPWEKLGYRPFRDDIFLKMEEKNFSEDGEDCTLVNWALGYEVDGSGYRVASFNYTVLDRMKKTEQTKKELEIISTILKSAEFGREEGISGDYIHNK